MSLGNTYKEVTYSGGTTVKSDTNKEKRPVGPDVGGESGDTERDTYLRHNYRTSKEGTSV